MTMKRTLILATALLAAAIGCSKKASTEPPAEPTAVEDVASGWSQFNNAGYTSAQSYFQSALGKDASIADAYNGKGWCQAILRNPTAALSTFKSGLAQAGANNEIKAGLAFTYSAMDSSVQAINKAQEVLLADSLWQFSHTYRPSARDNKLNYQEVVLLLAQSYLKLGQFANALLWVQKLNPGYSVDVGTTTGQAALQVEIERLAGTM
jgi:tetratricopeptide (TPR) repeat protein